MTYAQDALQTEQDVELGVGQSQNAALQAGQAAYPGLPDPWQASLGMLQVGQHPC